MQRICWKLYRTKLSQILSCTEKGTFSAQDMIILGLESIEIIWKKVVHENATAEKLTNLERLQGSAGEPEGQKRRGY